MLLQIAAAPFVLPFNEMSALLDDAFGSMDSEVAERKTALPLKETSAATANVVKNVVTD